MQDKLGTKVQIGDIITNLDSEYQMAVVIGFHNASTLEVIQWDNSEHYFFKNTWGNHFKVVGHISDDMDMEEYRRMGSKIRRDYITKRRAELQEELDNLDHMARDIFYDGENVGFHNAN